MKGTILTALAAGALILAGCTKTEVTDVPDSRAISFDNFVTNAVKATIDKNEDLNKFFVFGGYTSNEVFNNVPVTVAWDGGTSTCTYTPAKYWTENETYYFAAYSDNNKEIDGGVTFTEGTGHLTISGYIVDAFDDDLIYGYADNGGTGYSYDGSKHMDPVPFDFKHILSKVTFKFSKAADLNGTELTINNFSVNLKTTGTFIGEDLSGAQYPLTTWSSSGPASAFTEFSKAPLILNSDVTAGQPVTTVETGFTAIPQTITGYEISFTVTYKDPTDNQLEKVRVFNNVSIENTTDNNWYPGYYYIYTAEIKAVNLDLEPIVFTVNAVEGWDDEIVTGEIIGNDEGTIP